MRIRLCLLALVSLLTATTNAQRPATPPHVVLESQIDSGLLANEANVARVVFRETIQVADTAWLQLRFAHSTQLAAGSWLRLTAVEDGGVWQQHDAFTLGEWNRNSAAFNGDTVLLELIAGPQTLDNRVRVESVTRGLDEVFAEPETTCGTSDDRVQSFDERQGRLWLGCTGWLIGAVANNSVDAMLTAGHCQSSTTILELNVPNSTGGGTIVRSAPDDQYPYTSIDLLNGGAGADWQVCQVGRNSNTGLLPTEANGGQFYNLGTVPTSTSGQDVTVTGYGSTSPPNFLFAVQKTHTGPLSATAGKLCYGVDTSGGNSGSPVIDAITGDAIGIHTHGGCMVSSGCNSGTRIDRADLQAALQLVGILTGGFETFGAGCTGTGSQPALSSSLNPDGGTLVNRQLSYRVAYPANTETTLDLAAFELFTNSQPGDGAKTVTTAIYLADGSGKPTGTPIATGTMTIDETPDFYRTYLNATIPPGPFFLGVVHTGSSTNVSNLTSGVSNPGYYLTSGWNRSTSWIGKPSYKIYRVGGGGPAAPRMSATGVPTIGNSFSIDINEGRPNAYAVLRTGSSTTSLGNQPLPFALAQFGAPGCSLLVDEFFRVGTQLDATGAGSLEFTLPNDDQLVGLEFHHQWYVFDAPANPLGIVFSDGATSTVGG